MSDESAKLKTSGTIIKQDEKVYLVKDDRKAIQASEEIAPQAAVLWLEGLLGRKLTSFEFGLVISRPNDGGQMQITVTSAFVVDRSSRTPLLAGSYKPIGYFVRLRVSSRSVNYGDVIETQGFYDENGKLYGEVRQSRKQEPGLETPLLDPIDFVAGPLSNVIRGAAKSLISGAIAGIEERLLARGASSELAKLATLTEEELSAIRGGAASAKPPLMSADALNKPVPPISDQVRGGRRVLTTAERNGARQIIGVLERVRNGDEWAWAELIPGREGRIKPMQFGKWAQQGWNEIDLLTNNPGALNQMRMLVRVVKGDIEYQLRQVH